MTPPIPVPGSVLVSDAHMVRVEDQIQWYDSKARASLRWFRSLKTLTIVSASLITVITMATDPHSASRIAGVLGALVTTVEGIQHLNQYHNNWISYRSICEGLKHEKYLYLAAAGPYARAANARALFAERTESLMALEHTKWSSRLESGQPDVRHDSHNL